MFDLFDDADVVRSFSRLDIGHKINSYTVSHLKPSSQYRWVKIFHISVGSIDIDIVVQRSQGIEKFDE